MGSSSWGWLSSSADFCWAQSPCYGFTNVGLAQLGQLCSTCISSFVYQQTSQNMLPCFILWQRCKRAGLIEQALFKDLLISYLLTYWPKHVTCLSPKSGAIGEVWVSTTHGKGLRVKTPKRSFGFFHN